MVKLHQGAMINMFHKTPNMSHKWQDQFNVTSVDAEEHRLYGKPDRVCRLQRNSHKANMMMEAALCVRESINLLFLVLESSLSLMQRVWALFILTEILLYGPHTWTQVHSFAAEDISYKLHPFTFSGKRFQSLAVFFLFVFFHEIYIFLQSYIMDNRYKSEIQFSIEESAI